MTKMIDNQNDSPVIILVGGQEHLVSLRPRLEGLNAEFITTSEDKAHERASAQEVAVIVLDVQMCEKNDFELAEGLRRSQNTKGIPLMFLTTENQNISLFEGYDSAAVDVLSWSLPIPLLQSKMQVFLDLWGQRRSIENAHSQLEILGAELRRSDRALHDFTHMVAHDMKAPLRHIRGFIEMICEDHGDGLHDEVNRWLGMITDSTRKMNTLIGDLLDLAALDVVAFDLASVSLDEVIANVITDLELEINECGATIQKRDLPSVMGDRKLLHQLFHKLIGNSLKYHLPDTMPVIELWCDFDAAGQQCTISVRDNGIGFDQKHAEWVFLPLKRLVSSSQFEGSGLGMTSAKKIVDRHGGHIAALGEEGVGATFSISLPLASIRDAT